MSDLRPPHESIFLQSTKCAETPESTKPYFPHFGLGNSTHTLHDSSTGNSKLKNHKEHFTSQTHYSTTRITTCTDNMHKFKDSRGINSVQVYKTGLSRLTCTSGYSTGGMHSYRARHSRSTVPSYTADGSSRCTYNSRAGNCTSVTDSSGVGNCVPGTRISEIGNSTAGINSSGIGNSTADTHSSRIGNSTADTYSSRIGNSTADTYSSRIGNSTAGINSSGIGNSIADTHSSGAENCSSGTHSSRLGNYTADTHSSVIGKCTAGKHSSRTGNCNGYSHNCTGRNRIKSLNTIRAGICRNSIKTYRDDNYINNLKVIPAERCEGRKQNHNVGNCNTSSTKKKAGNSSYLDSYKRHEETPLMPTTGKGGVSNVGGIRIHKTVPLVMARKDGECHTFRRHKSQSVSRIDLSKSLYRGNSLPRDRHAACTRYTSTESAWKSRPNPGNSHKPLEDLDSEKLHLAVQEMKIIETSFSHLDNKHNKDIQIVKDKRLMRSIKKESKGVFSSTSAPPSSTHEKGNNNLSRETFERQDICVHVPDSGKRERKSYRDDKRRSNKTGRRKPNLGIAIPETSSSVTSLHRFTCHKLHVASHSLTLQSSKARQNYPVVQVKCEPTDDPPQNFVLTVENVDDSCLDAPQHSQVSDIAGENSHSSGFLSVPSFSQFFEGCPSV